MDEFTTLLILLYLNRHYFGWKRFILDNFMDEYMYFWMILSILFYFCLRGYRVCDTLPTEKKIKNLVIVACDINEVKLVFRNVNHSGSGFSQDEWEEDTWLRGIVDNGHVEIEKLGLPYLLGLLIVVAQLLKTLAIIRFKIKIKKQKLLQSTWDTWIATSWDHVPLQ